MFIFYITFSVQEYVRHLDTDLYICNKAGNNISNGPVGSCKGLEATNWKIMNRNGSGIVKTADESGVTNWDIAQNTEMMVYSYHGGPNQIFEFRPASKGAVQIVNRDKCVQYDIATDKYLYKTCDPGNKNQLFEIFVEHPAKVVKSTPMPVVTSFNQIMSQSPKIACITHEKAELSPPVNGYSQTYQFRMAA